MTGIERGAAVRIIDLHHQGRPESVLATLLQSRDGGYVVDPGPASCLGALEAGLTAAGIAVADLAGILLTHIHLDHAGASGTLARMNPRLRVWVHEAGAPHVIDPSKLLTSAARLYGDRMDALWGEVAPVPAGRVIPLAGGERLELGGRVLEVAHTPGHAVHHVSYFERSTGTACVGDTAGIRSERLPVVLPVTPPPEFDLEAWLASLDRIAAWDPARLVVTHFGVWTDVREHLAALREGLTSWAGYARETLDEAGTDADRTRAFVRRLERWIDGKAPADRVAKFLAGPGPAACWQGLARYWRKRGSP